MSRLLDNLCGLYELARLAAITGFRFRGRWWRWRMHTAFGRAGPLGFAPRLSAALEYGRWVHRMRRTG